MRCWTDTSTNHAPRCPLSVLLQKRCAHPEPREISPPPHLERALVGSHREQSPPSRVKTNKTRIIRSANKTGRPIRERRDLKSKNTWSQSKKNCGHGATLHAGSVHTLHRSIASRARTRHTTACVARRRKTEKHAPKTPNNYTQEATRLTLN